MSSDSSYNVFAHALEQNVGNPELCTVKVHANSLERRKGHDRSVYLVVEEEVIWRTRCAVEA
jgi:hypothetical protein